MANVDKMIESLIKEAKSAPKLFADLSKLEKYIAETYKNRSIIELIQNADDAQSTLFGIHKTSFGCVVGNNGRVFTDEDLESLCRSGSSNKQRGGNTIGYRGIGFKSVVGLANQIILISGDCQLCFDKQKTKDLLQLDEVPTIRIPHIINIAKTNYYTEIMMLLSKYGYSTIFALVDINDSNLGNELSQFDYSCLFFLNNITDAILDSPLKHLDLHLNRTFYENQSIISVFKNGEAISEWLLNYGKNKKNVIAFKYDNGRIVPSAQGESVIHSFMPSYEFSGGLFKINGDFSTDPSRKHIDMDEISKEALEQNAIILSNLIADALLNRTKINGVFSTLVDLNYLGLSEAGKTFIKMTNKKLWDNQNVKLNKIRMCPSWLNTTDYVRLCELKGIGCISQNNLTNNADCVPFLLNIGVPQLSLYDIIDSIDKCSEEGMNQILVQLISQSYFDMTQQKIDNLKALSLFPKNDRPDLCKAEDIQNINEINVNTLNFLLQNISPSHLESFFNPLGILCEFENNDDNSIKFIPTKKNKNNITIIDVSSSTKWRSSEIILTEYLSKINDIKTATDVSSANIGYDIEIIFRNGAKAYIEVKSVSTFRELFKMTNNEYSTAHAHQDDYYLALVVNSNSAFEVIFIQNPIKNINLFKQCEKWTWICNNIKDSAISINQFIQNNS